MGTRKNSKKKLQITVMEIPTSIDEVNDSVSAIAKKQAEINAVAKEYGEKILDIQNEAAKKSSILSEEINRLFAGVYSFCESNRPELTKDGKKTIELPSGVICWRFNPPSVALRTSAKKAIEALRKAKLNKFIRIKREINKEAILAHSEDVANISGIEIVQMETFNIKPYELPKEISKESDFLKTLIPERK